MPTKELVLDERRRTSLAKVGRRSDSRYLVQEFPDGTLVLTPAVTVSSAEWAALSNPDVMRAIDKARSTGDRQLLNRPRRSQRRRATGSTQTKGRPPRMG